MSAPSTTAAAEAAGTHTVLSFDDDTDHCSYDPHRILAALTAAERATVAATFPTAADDWVTSVDLYCATEELEELGHTDLATTLGQFIHGESIYGCLCRNEALAEFKQQVGVVLAELEDRIPHGTWWTRPRVYAHGLDVDNLLEDLGWSDREGDRLTVTLDAQGNGSVTSGSASLELVAFPTPELGTFTQRLDDGDIATGGNTVTAVEDWMRLPTDVRETMAALHFHDVALAGTGTADGQTRCMDLSLEQLEQVARRVTALPEPVGSAVVSLLPGTTSTLEDLIAAVQATGLRC